MSTHNGNKNDFFIHHPAGYRRSTECHIFITSGNGSSGKNKIRTEILFCAVLNTL